MHRERYEDRTIGCCLIFFSTIRQLLCKNVRNTEELEICKKIIQEIKEFNADTQSNLFRRYRRLEI